MGLLRSKKKTYVSSSVWNLAGDIKDRPNFLKTTVLGNVMSHYDTSMAETLTISYLNGPGIGLRRYARWASELSTYAEDVGFVSGSLAMGDTLNYVELAKHIPKEPETMVSVFEGDTGFADYYWWAEEYMLNNDLENLFTDWTAEISDGANEITITLVDGVTTYKFTPIDFDPTKRYLYCLYSYVFAKEDGDKVDQPEIFVSGSDQFPPLGIYRLYTEKYVPNTEQVTKLTVVDITYSDATPPQHSEQSEIVDEDSLTLEKVHHYYEVKDSDYSTRYIYTTREQSSTVNAEPEVTVTTEDVGGVTKTTTTTVTYIPNNVRYSYQYSVQNAINNQVSTYRYFRYVEGGGNPDLDALFVSSVSVGKFLPFIPIRLNNKFVEDLDPELFTKTKRAFNKATGSGRLNNVLDSIKDNKSLGDLDFIFTVFGASLNTPEKLAKAYIYNFFESLINTNPNSELNFENFKIKWKEASASAIAYRQWLRDKQDHQQYPWRPNPGPKPIVVPYPTLPKFEFRTKSSDPKMHFDMLITMNGGNKFQGTGLIEGKKVGDCWFKTEPDLKFEKAFSNSNDNRDSNSYWSYRYYDTSVLVSQTTMYHQESANRWTAVKIYGLVHNNNVYNNKSVTIEAADALSDDEESGFIIPIHQIALKEMSLVDATQMATACSYLVFNCYKVVKKKWYQSGIFQVVLVVAAVVIAVVFPPSAAGSVGILGSSAAVGGALGFTGMVAVAVGAAANAIAAIVLSTVLTKAFGGTVGTLLAMAVTVGASAYHSMANAGTSISTSSVLTELSKAPNLLAITNGLVNSVNAYMGEQAMKYQKDAEKYLAQHEKDMKELNDKYTEMFGDGTRADTSIFTDAAKHDFTESSTMYMLRTLMTGSDIAQMSMDIVNNFTDVSLALESPI